MIVNKYLVPDVPFGGGRMPNAFMYSVFLWASLFGFNIQPTVADLYFVRDLPPGFEYIMAAGRPIVTAGVAFMLLTSFLSKPSGFNLTREIWLFLLFRVALAARRVVVYGDADSVIKESLGLVLISGILAAYSWRAPSAGSPLAFLRRCSRVSMYALVIYLMVCIGLAILRPGAVFNAPGRLFGLNGHPNEFSISISMLLILAQYEEIRLRRVSWISILSVTVLVLVVLSGSRVGMLTYLCSLAMLVISFWGQFSGLTRGFISIVGAPCAIIGVIVLSVSEFVGDLRVLSTANTRQEVFSSLFNNFLANPLLGNPAGTGATSNSVLYAASSTGLLGLAILMVFAFYILKGLKICNRFPRHERIFMFTCVSAVMVSMTFSGYLCEYIQFPLIFTFLWLSILGRLVTVRRRFSGKGITVVPRNLIMQRSNSRGN